MGDLLTWIADGIFQFIMSWVAFVLPFGVIMILLGISVGISAIKNLFKKNNLPKNRKPKLARGF